MKKGNRTKSLLYKLNYFFFTYRYDIFSLSFMLLLILWYVSPVFNEGHIVFSDIDFPLDSRRYPEQIFGLWNERWSTGTLLNLPRLVFIAFPWLLSALFDYSGPLFFKSFLIMILTFAAMSQYVFTRKLIKVYQSREITFYHTLILIPGGLLYALNPWVIYRIQHIYLLCGYSLFPLMLLFFFNTFDPRFLKQNIKGYSVFHNRFYKRNILDAALLALILSTMSAGIHYFFYSALLLFLFFVLLLGKTLATHIHGGGVRLRAIGQIFIKKGFLFVFFFLLFAFHWLSVYAAGILTGNRPSQFNINVIDTLVLFSRNSSLKNVLFLNSYWWPMFPLEELPFSFYMAGGVILFFIVAALLYKSWKHSILLFLGLLALTLIILSRGVNNEGTAELFVFFVTQVPVVGAMFRDPDKLIGILTFSYSTLLVFGIISLGEIFRDRSRPGSILRFLFLASLVSSLFFYLLPYRDYFFKGFYYPVEVPGEYSEINRKFEIEENKGKALYIPNSENMIQSHTGVATPFWNNNEGGYEKPTGDFHVYNSLKNTIFHHEGSIPEISYYMNYLQYLLDRGLSENIINYASVFSADEVIYHKEYKGQDTRQSFNKAVLSHQIEKTLNYENDIFTSYSPLNYPDFQRLSGRRVFTPYGLSHLEIFADLEGFNWSDYSIIFTAQNKGSYFQALRPGDIIASENFNDLFLSSLDEDYYLSPFDFINDGNPYLKWSKTRINTADWLWYLQSQGIERNNFDFEPEAGLAVTFASSKLDIPPYEMGKLKGELLIDFNSLLRIEKFFVADNPHIFSAEANPLGPGNDLPVLHGEIQKGESADIWQVAKSGLLNVTGDTPYQFRISLSGRGANKMHVKVRFFDEDLNELGITYVIAPSEEISFDGMTLYGEYVSPAEASQMRIDLLSFQRPEQKTYWWIHDIKISDLKKYRAPNRVNMTRTVEKSGEYRFYARVFNSPKGGAIELAVNDEQKLMIESRSPASGFIWHDLGSITLEEGENLISLENRSGFNAVNTFVLIPTEDFDVIAQPFTQASRRGSQLIAAEAESGFHYEGNIQTQRRYPAFHSGDAIRADRGVLEKSFEVFQNGFYKLSILTGKPEFSRGSINFEIVDKAGDTVVEKIFSPGDLPEEPHMGREVIFDPLRYKDFPRRFSDKIYGLDRYGVLTLDNITLEKGSYRMKIAIDSAVDSLAALDDLELFDPSRIGSDYFLEDVENEDCSDCIRLLPHMSRRRMDGDVLVINYDKTCSCDWFVYSSYDMEVREGREYLFDFTARSENVKKRHTKILFLDSGNQIVGTSFIHEVEEKYKEEFNRYEQIITAPQKAERMIFQVWCRGDEESEGIVEMKDLKIIPMDSLLLIDSVKLEEIEEHKLWRPFDNLVISSESFSTIRRTEGKMLIDKAIPVNSVSTGYLVEDERIPDFPILFSKLYKLGLFLLPVGLAVLIVLMKIKYRD